MTSGVPGADTDPPARTGHPLPDRRNTAGSTPTRFRTAIASPSHRFRTA